MTSDPKIRFHLLHRRRRRVKRALREELAKPGKKPWDVALKIDFMDMWRFGMPLEPMP